ncbi:MAG: Hsp20/alpha crystallin family protein [Rubrivivax sp.]|jgi:HSP20 family protein
MLIVPLHRYPSELARPWAHRRTDHAAAEAEHSPALDVTETERHYLALLDLPGVHRDQVQVSIEGRQVRVQTQTAADSASQPEATPTGRPLHRERATGPRARSFMLPQEVEASQASAKLEHGVLTLTLPKRSTHGAAQITVN